MVNLVTSNSAFGTRRFPAPFVVQRSAGVKADGRRRQHEQPSIDYARDHNFESPPANRRTASHIYQIIPSCRKRSSSHRMVYCHAFRILRGKTEVMGKVIPFYVPDAFRPKANAQMVAQRERGKVIEFRVAEAKKPA